MKKNFFISGIIVFYALIVGGALMCFVLWDKINTLSEAESSLAQKFLGIQGSQAEGLLEEDE